MKTEWFKLGIYTAAYVMSFVLGEAGLSAPSGLCLIFAAAFLYLSEYQRTQSLLNLRGLLALGLLGGEGVARFQLSRLSTDWTLETWLSFYLFYLIFDLSAQLTEHAGTIRSARAGDCAVRRASGDVVPEPSASAASIEARDAGGGHGRTAVGEEECPEMSEHEFSHGRTAVGEETGPDLRFFQYALLGLLGISWAAFLFEARRLGFVPLFTVDTPHAYSYFHVKGVHYFTTLAVLTPAVSMLYLGARRKHGLSPDILALLGLLLPILLTILMVSRFQFMISVILAVFVALLSGRRYRLWQLLLLLVLMIAAYVFITIERAHSVEYLNGIFEMKDPSTPIFITQPYMYIANNYDNFNVMTRELTVHAHGLRMLYPFVTLSGLKFFVPALAQGFPLFVTKEELTTVTMLYDAWYDFGLLGIAVFALVLGLVSGRVTRACRKDQNPFSVLLYAQLAFYYLVSFFTTWFSNPATWFYLGISFVLYLAYACSVRKRRSE